jgi:mannose-6-phosphate isomerase-like protein (cupin superfamily)
MTVMVEGQPQARLKIAYEEYVCEVDPMDDKVNLAEKLALLGFLNDYKLAVVKAEGEFVWHKHDDTDDFFLVLSGRLTIQLRDRDVSLGQGEVFVVPRGVEHRPRADREAHVLLIEPRGTVNTGDAGGELTQPERVI